MDLNSSPAATTASGAGRAEDHARVPGQDGTLGGGNGLAGEPTRGHIDQMGGKDRREGWSVGAAAVKEAARAATRRTRIATVAVIVIMAGDSAAVAVLVVLDGAAEFKRHVCDTFEELAYAGRAGHDDQEGKPLIDSGKAGHAK